MSKIKDLLRKLPNSAGVYQFLDETGKVVYIGKAKNLKNRVKSYFQKSTDKTPKAERLVEVAKDIKWIETVNEVEALTLESNLVREQQPRFNAQLKDDKHFLYFKITNEDFPRLLTVRSIEDDGAQYFGPKTDSKSVRNTIRLVQKLFKLRTCNLGLEERSGKVQITKKGIKYPCVDAHIKLCDAPCTDGISRAEYAENVEQAIAFLKGDAQPIIRSLRGKMQAAATGRKFELAAQLRDKVQSVENMSAKQLASDPDLASRDVFGLKIDFSKAYFAVLQIRNGKLIDSKNFVVRTGESEMNEVLAAFIVQFYELATDFPGEILLPTEVENSELLESWLRDRAGQKIKILTPQKGKKESLLQLAEKNAAAFTVQSKAKYENATERTVGAAAELARELGIDRELKRIEAYDISHLGGEGTSGSMVVLIRGEPESSQYRQFKIKTVKQGKVDDYASLAETLGRRMNYLVTQEPPGYKIRRARKADAKILEKSKLRDFETMKQLSQLSDYLVVEYEKKVVAIAQIHEWKKEKLHGLYSVMVDPDHRGKRLGQRLVRALLKKTKAKKVYLNCHHSLVEYYTEVGFQEIRKTPSFLESSLREYCRNTPEVKFVEQIFMMWERKSAVQDASFAAKPDLVILDGGKGQLSTVLKNVKFPKTTHVVALAKREEEIFKTPPNPPLQKGGATKSERILLARDSQALYLVQRIRDEAHRFANSLRKKQNSLK